MKTVIALALLLIVCSASIADQSSIPFTDCGTDTYITITACYVQSPVVKGGSD